MSWSVKKKVFLVLNALSTMPWRHMRELCSLEGIPIPISNTSTEGWIWCLHLQGTEVNCKGPIWSLILGINVKGQGYKWTNETLVNLLLPTQRHISKDSYLHIHGHENYKSHKAYCTWTKNTSSRFSALTPFTLTGCRILQSVSPLWQKLQIYDWFLRINRSRVMSQWRHPFEPLRKWHLKSDAVRVL
jgi:hypothetical protein